MDLFSFAPIAAVLGMAHAAVGALAAVFGPVAGSTAAALAIVVLTLLVRTALIPVGISQVEAEWTRRRLSPGLRELQRKYEKNPRLLQRETLDLYREESASPFAGLLPALAQALGIRVRFDIQPLLTALLTMGSVDWFHRVVQGVLTQSHCCSNLL